MGPEKHYSVAERMFFDEYGSFMKNHDMPLEPTGGGNLASLLNVDPLGGRNHARSYLSLVPNSQPKGPRASDLMHGSLHWLILKLRDQVRSCAQRAVIIQRTRLSSAGWPNSQFVEAGLRSRRWWSLSLELGGLYLSRAVGRHSARRHHQRGSSKGGIYVSRDLKTRDDKCRAASHAPCCDSNE